MGLNELNDWQLSAVAFFVAYLLFWFVGVILFLVFVVPA